MTIAPPPATSRAIAPTSAGVLIVRSRSLPVRTLPIVGATVVPAIVLVGFTSSYGFFTRFPGPKL